MFDIRQLPDAWDSYYKLSGEEGRENEKLYDIYYKISTAIFRYRVRHKLSQKKLAEKLGVTQAMVSKLESGDYNYTIEQLWKVSSKLGLQFDVIFEEEKEEISITRSGTESTGNVIEYPELAVG
ncbi:MAG: helix-turn-helix transcriptional regulator [Bacillota bacterium]|nr:helix-turn-helix transcriptional regulator [Patescibacteria group bacterium]MDW7730334.1 helix-turn-helix transcriptional regulator [Bacillota bacterium]